MNKQKNTLTPEMVSPEHLKLIESEEKFRTIAEFTYDWETWLNPDGKLLYTSPSCKRITGYPANEFLEKSSLLIDIVHDSDRSFVESHHSATELRSEKDCSIEFRIINRDGSVKWISHACQPVITEDGRFLGRRGSNRDITNNKINEEELLRSKKILDETGRLARIGSWEMDLIKNSLYWSEITHKIHEAEPGFIPDLSTAINFYAPEAIPVISKCVEEAITKGKPFDVELQLITVKNNRLWVRAIGEAYKENGKVVKIAGVFQDIDQIKRANIELELSRQKLSLHIKNTPLGVVEFNVDGRITEWNIAAENIFGFSKKEAIGSEWTIIAPERFLSKLEGVWESIVTQKGGNHSTNENQTKEGKVIMCDWFNTPLVNEEGKTIGIASLVVDITEQLKVQDELKIHRDHLEELVVERTRELDNAIANLQRSNQELEQFAYVASHDLQEPLRMVASYTQLLERRYKDQLDQDAKDFINYAVDGANRMQRLINDLLDFSRVTTKGKPIVKLDLSTVLGQAVANLHNKIQETGSMIVNEDLPFAYGDEGQLVRVFQNLIDNAIKFRGGETPRISISSEILDDKVKISIADNGIGIDKIYTERVFTIFQRLHNKADYPGTGIGLAICKRTIERHGGKIWFESEPGHGTTFCFTINTK